MEKAIKKYKGLPNKELTVAFSKVRRDLDRVANQAFHEAELQAENLDEHKPSSIKRLEKFDTQMDKLQSEMDAIGMLKTGRF